MVQKIINVIKTKYFLYLLLFFILIISGSFFVYKYYSTLNSDKFDVVVADNNLIMDYINPNSQMIIYLNKDVDKNSLKDNYKVIPDLKGDIKVDKNKIIFLPSDELKVDDIYTFVLSENIKSIDGQILGQSFSQIFKVVDYPKVILATPIFEMKDPINDKINIVFNTRLNPITNIQELDLKEKIKINPSVSGKYKFVGGNTISFKPNDQFDFDTTYTVDVTTDFVFANGSKLKDPYQFKFVTPKLNIIFDNEVDKNFVKKDNILSAKLKVSLGTSGSSILIDNYIFDVSKINLLKLNKFVNEGVYNYDDIKSFVGDSDFKQVQSNINLDKDNNIFVQNLELDSFYALKFNEVIYKNNVLKDIYLVFHSPNRLKVVGTTPSHEEGTKNFNSISIEFNNDIKNIYTGSDSIKQFENYLSGMIIIKPDIADKSVSFYNNYIYINGNLKPMTVYNVKVRSDITDVYDTNMLNDYDFIFLTYDYDKNLSFVDYNTTVLLPALNDIKIPFYSTNIKNVNIELCKISNEQYIQSRLWENMDKMDYKLNSNDCTVINRELMYEKNVQKLNYVDIYNDFKNIQEGIYMIKIDSPDFYDADDDINNFQSKLKDYSIKRMIILTNTTLTLKTSEEQVFVWATDNITGMPIIDAVIEVYQNNKLIVTGKTNEDGVFISNYNLPESWGEITAIMKYEKFKYEDIRSIVIEGVDSVNKNIGFGIVSSYWNEGIGLWNFNIIGGYYQNDVSYLYTDRPIYRPGQKVYIKGIVRNLDDKYRLKLPELNTLKLYVQNSKGEKIYETSVKLSKNGTYNTEFVLANDVPLGMYSVNTDNYGYASFWVKEYEKPIYKVSIDTDKDDFVDKENVKVKILSQYYFGGSIANADTQLYVSSEDYYFDKYTGNKQYIFWDSDDDYCVYCWWVWKSPNYKTENKLYAKTNTDGIYMFDVPINIKEEKISKRYLFEASITDPNTNDIISKEKSVFVHKAFIYPGIYLDKNYYAKGNDILADIITVSYTGQVIPNVDVDINVYNIKWNTIQKQDVDGTFYFDNQAEEIEVIKDRIKTNKEGKFNKKFSILNGGQYKIYLTVYDQYGNKNKSSATFFVSDRDKYINWFSSNDFKIDVNTDKNFYKIGDIAKILIRAPFDDFYILITNEKTIIDNYKVLKVDNTTYSIDVPITADMQSDYYIGISAIKKGSGISILPQFRQGYAKLYIDQSDKVLNINISTDKQVYKPREKVSLNINITDINKKPIKNAEVSVAVVDESVLALKDTALPNLIKVFYNIWGLKVNTASSLIKMISKSELEAADKAFTSSAKGGGGGDNDIDKRAKFEDTAVFYPSLISDVNGNINTEFELPDNLTTWRIIAIASTQNNLFGANNYNFYTRLPLMIIPNIPRFVTNGDKTSFGGVIKNNTDKDLNIKVGINISSGADLISSGIYLIDVPKNQLVPFNFDVQINDMDYKNIFIEFFADGDEYKDRVIKYIPKYSYYTKESVSINGIVNNIENIPIKIGASGIIDNKLNVKIGATIIDNIVNIYSHFDNFKYDSSEGILSYILQLALMLDIQNNILNDTANKVIFFNKEDSDIMSKCIDKNNCDYNMIVKDIINQGIQKIYIMKNDDGGFSYFKYYNNESNPYLTTYILFGLQKLKSLGYIVDDNVLSQINNYLKNQLQLKDFDKNYSDDFKAFLAYILSDKTDAESIANKAYSNINKLSIDSICFLLMAYINIDTQRYSLNIDTLKNKLINSISINDRYAQLKLSNINYYLMQTEYKSNILATLTLLELQKNIGDSTDKLAYNELIYKLINGLNIKDYTLSTYENIWTMLMYIEYFKYYQDQNANFIGIGKIFNKDIFNVTFDKNNIFDSYSTGIDISSISDIKWFNLYLEKKGQGNMYYNVTYQYNLVDKDIEPINNGFEVLKDFIEISSGADVITESKVGSIIKSKVTLFVPETRYNVALVDYLPAGSEAVDFDLDTSMKSLEYIQDEKNKCDIWYKCWDDQNWRFTYKEFKDDRVMIFAEYLPKGVYTYEYYIKLKHAGNFNIRPTYVEQIYYPEVFGRTKSYNFNIIK